MNELMTIEVSELAALRSEIAELKESHEKILLVITDIFNQVGPTIDALKNNPMLKMLF